jgi:hypothetical protein
LIAGYALDSKEFDGIYLGRRKGNDRDHDSIRTAAHPVVPQPLLAYKPSTVGRVTP